MQVTDENLIVLEVRNLIMSMLESTITLPHLWGRTVGKAAKTEPSALRPAFRLTIESSWHVTQQLRTTLCLLSSGYTGEPRTNSMLYFLCIFCLCLGIGVIECPSRCANTHTHSLGSKVAAASSVLFRGRLMIDSAVRWAHKYSEA